MNYLYLLMLFALFLFSSCEEEKIDGLNNTDKSLPLTQRMNNYTEGKMKSIYLWAQEVSNLNVNQDIAPELFFKSLVYHKEDPWSYIDNTVGSVSANTDGYDDAFGYDLQFYSGNDLIFAQICYVYPGTPAARGGLKRGDIIYKMNGQYLDYFNTDQLKMSGNIEIELADLVVNTLHPQDRKIKLRSVKTDVSPILVDTVLNYSGQKIGYLHYTEFADNRENSLKVLSAAADKLKERGVQKLILDLRYNQGGYLTAARHLCSLLAPRAAVEKESLLITKHWNEEYQKKYAGTEQMQEERFDKGVLSHNLNLQQLYVITSTRTASASELLISSLRPYMQNITLIGTRTTGKYVASTSFQPNDSELRNWVLHPIVFAYRNAASESVKEGLSPDIFIKETPQTMLPLGSDREPLLRAALNAATNRPQEPVEMTRRGDIFVPFESNASKRNSMLLVPFEP